MSRAGVRRALALLALTSLASAGDNGERVDVRGMIGKRAVTLSHGVAWVDALNIHLYLTDRPWPCGAAVPDKIVALQVPIPPGPGTHYFNHGVVGITLFYQGQDVPPTANAYGSGEAAVTLDAVGDRVRGKLWMSSRRVAVGRVTAKGRFDVPICGGAATLERGIGLPDLKPRGPFTGVIAGRTLRARSALAFVRVESTGHRAVDSVALFEAREPSCDRESAAWKGSWVELVNVQGGVPGMGYRGPQPADAVFHIPGLTDDANATGRFGGAWIQFDELRIDHAPGRVRGFGLAQSQGNEWPPAKLGQAGGRFTATICLEKN